MYVNLQGKSQKGSRKGKAEIKFPGADNSECGGCGNRASGGTDAHKG